MATVGHGIRGDRRSMPSLAPMNGDCASVLGAQTVYNSTITNGAGLAGL